jgi:hypothetical protein
MIKKLTTALGLTLIAGSLAFASQAPSTNSNQAATKPAAAPAKSAKKRRRHHHHKRHATPNVTPNSSTPKQ